MAVPDETARDFPPHIRERGERYFQAGSVELTSADETTVEARVHGSHGHTYQVTLVQLPSGELATSCTCPYGIADGKCKHVWATLLEAEEASGIPGGPPRPPRPNEFPPSGGEPGPRAAGGRRDPPAPGDGRPGARDAAEPWPAWRRQLHALGSSRLEPPPHERVKPWPAGRRLIYVIDAHASAMRADGVVIEVMSETQQKDGGFSPPKPFRASRTTWLAAPDIQDREIAQMLLGTAGEYGYFAGVGSASRFIVMKPAFDTTLRRMVETGRARVRVAPETRDMPVAWDAGGEWEVRLRVTMIHHAGERSSLRLAGIFVRPGAEMPVDEPEILVRGGLLVAHDRIGRYADPDVFSLLFALRTNLKVEVEGEQALDLIEELYRMRSLPPLELPEELQISEIHEPPVPQVSLRQLPSGVDGTARVEGAVTFDYGGVEVGVQDASRAFFKRETMRMHHRDAAAEEAAMASLSAAGFRREYDYQQHRQVWRTSPARSARAAAELVQLGWKVNVDGAALRQAGTWDFELQETIDWFELKGSVSFGGVKAALPELLSAVQRGEHRVALADGSFGLVPDDLFDRLALLAAVGGRSGGRLRYKRGQVGLLDAMLASLPGVRVDEAFARIRRELQRFDGITPADAPEGFSGTLRPYQREGLGWLHFLRQFGFGGCLADDMGLGKTVQALALLESRRAAGAGVSLVVVPNSLVFNWQQEAARFAPQLRVWVHAGSDRRRDGEHFAGFDLVITTYGILRRDVTELSRIPFDYVILDEAQAIKNATTVSAKAARLLRAQHRIAMSGTPVENRLTELWSLLEFLNPGLLGSTSGFSRLIKANDGGGADRPQAPEQLALLARAVRPYFLRRTKEQVAADLPPKLEQTLLVDLSPPERKRYDELRDYYRGSILRGLDAAGRPTMQVQILEALLRLRQAACHPGLVAAELAGEPSSKLDVLEVRLREIVAEGHKVLVFSQFTSLLAIVKPMLDKAGIVYEYLDGKTTNRQAPVERFQSDPQCPVFLISLKAGGLGLNLTAADYVFLLDPWWNPAVEQQAIDRAHRIGQTRRVFATRIIARDTVEEKVLLLQERKRGLAEAIVRAETGPMASLTREDLELLLS
jgi:superfamily II DNA or RNA helicase